MAPLVSVIVPCHDRSVLLLDCLASLLQQTYSPIEVIVVDDSSTEDILGVVQSLPRVPGKRVQVVRSNTQIGPGAARELGRCHIHGEYVCYQDSDDWWSERKIEAQISVLSRNLHAGMCYCTAALFSELPVIGNEQVRYLSDRSYSAVLPMLLITRRRPWGTGSCMWTRTAIEKIGPWLPCSVWEDMEYDCRAGCKDIPIIHLSQTLCFYRTQPHSNQLRNRRQTLQIQLKTHPIVRIGYDLRCSGKFKDADILDAYTRLVHDHSLALLRAAEHSNFYDFIRELEQIGLPKTLITERLQFLTNVLTITRSGAATWCLGRLLNKLAPL
jgi:glycosyltransferase involved in cell wall biosynthesis